MGLVAKQGWECFDSQKKRVGVFWEFLIYEKWVTGWQVMSDELPTTQQLKKA